MGIINGRQRKRARYRANVSLNANMFAPLLVLFAFLFLPGCRNPLRPWNTDEGGSAQTGTLSLTIARQDRGRTIMPEILPENYIDRFDFRFSDAGDPTGGEYFIRTLTRSDGVWTGGSGAAWSGTAGVELELYEGIWDLCVTAFLYAGGGEGNAVARGTLYGIDVSPGETVAGNVELFPIAVAGGPSGSFCWNINFPNDVARVRMEIQHANDDTGAALYSFYLVRDDGMPYSNPHRHDLGAGRYLVVFTLYEYPVQPGRGVEVSAVLHIYQNMVSEFTGGNVFPGFRFPCSLLGIILDAWNYPVNDVWNFAHHEITAGHFGIYPLNIIGINTINFGAVVGQLDDLANLGNVPTTLEELRALVDAALIGINRHNIIAIINYTINETPGAGEYEKAAAIRGLLGGPLGFVRNTDYNTVAIGWGIGTVILTVQGIPVSIDFVGDVDDPDDIIWLASARGTPTNAIDFIFSAPVPGLTLSNIQITPPGAVTPETLTSAPDERSWILTIVPVTSPGIVSISINRDGIASGPQTVTVTDDGITEPDIVWLASARGTPTNAIDFIFSEPVPGLTLSNIQITPPGAVTPETLTSVADERSWVLTIAPVTSPGSVSISINRDGIASGSQTVAVVEPVPIPEITWTPIARGIPTTSIDFVFSASVSGLELANFEITGSPSAVDLVGGGILWTLNISGVTASGNITVAIVDRAEIASGPQTVPVTAPVLPIAWTAYVYPPSPSYTTAIHFEFDYPTGLATENISAFPPTVGSILPGLVTPLDSSMQRWSVAVAVIQSGPVNVRITRSGISTAQQMVQVIRPPIPWGAEAIGGPYTTGISLIFGGNVSGLTSGQIELEPGTPGAVALGDFTESGSRARWTLPVTVINPGYVRLRVNRPNQQVEDRWEQFVVSAPAPPLLVPANVSAGFFHTVTIRADGSLWAWGFNDFGRIGDGTTTTRESPVQIGSNTDWVYVSAGIHHTVALRTDGRLYAWGLGPVGMTGQQNAPVQITGTWLSVTTGQLHTVAIRDGGLLYAWGNNDDGRFGVGTTMSSPTPVRVGGDTDWAFVSAGYNHTVAIRNNGSLWAWGNNQFGQLGDGTTETSLIPVQIGMDTDWRHVSAGRHRTVAIRNDNTLWAWGYNESGQLGDGTTETSLIPVQIGLETWRYVSTSTSSASGDTAARGHTIAIAIDGSLWAWGVNLSGQLGIGGTAPQNSPQLICNANIWSSVSAGDQHSVATREDGSVWVWGSNERYQLGIGQPSNIPQQVPLP